MKITEKRREISKTKKFSKNTLFSAIKNDKHKRAITTEFNSVNFFQTKKGRRGMEHTSAFYKAELTSKKMQQIQSMTIEKKAITSLEKTVEESKLYAIILPPNWTRKKQQIISKTNGAQEQGNQEHNGKKTFVAKNINSHLDKF